MTREEIRKLAEEDLGTFAVLLNPLYLYGEVHFEVFRWLQNNHFSQLLLLPRGHLKSHCIAVWCTWWITKHPETSIIYVSATEKLALQQLYAIKGMLDSPVYRRYWPEMLNPEEGKREKWSAFEVKVDHPARKAQGIRDATVLVASVGGNTTGLHCDVLALDDLVVPDNAYTEAGRDDVSAAYSQFSSVLNPGGILKACGTRYHPGDIYGAWVDTKVETYSEDGQDIIGEEPEWAVFEKQVHNQNGVFLWPRTKSTKTQKWYGFDNPTLARIRARYYRANQKAQYFAQYFNNPNDVATNRLTGNHFQYFNRERIEGGYGSWMYGNEPLSLAAAADFAYTTGEKSDFTAIAVVGCASNNSKFILDLVQFKTNKYEDYYKAILALYNKWGFHKLKVEVNAGANLIAQYIKDRLRQEGVFLALEVQNSLSDKVERTAAVLEPEYEQNRVFHFQGGLMNEYEEQLVLSNPLHDDLRDAVTMAVEIVRPPVAGRKRFDKSNVIPASGRFGGMRR